MKTCFLFSLFYCLWEAYGNVNFYLFWMYFQPSMRSLFEDTKSFSDPCWKKLVGYCVWIESFKHSTNISTCTRMSGVDSNPSPITFPVIGFWLVSTTVCLRSHQKSVFDPQSVLGSIILMDLTCLGSWLCSSQGSASGMITSDAFLPAVCKAILVFECYKKGLQDLFRNSKLFADF